MSPTRYGQANGCFLVNVVRNVLFAGALTRVLRLLGDAGIRVIPVKGVTLAESLYGDPAFRFCADIDILLPVSEVLRARRLFLAQGYTSPFTEDSFFNHQFHTKGECPLLSRREPLPYLLELHWTLPSVLRYSSKDAEAMQDLWSQARPRDCFGIRAYSLTPEWEFLYLSVHAACHKWQTLKWVADIHDLCVSTPIDWQKVREKAERFDLNLEVGSTLAACSLLYGAPVPANFSSCAIPAGIQLFPNSLAPSEAWEAPLLSPKLLKRPSEKLRWFAKGFFVPTLADGQFFHLPRSLEFLYYLLRPVRLTFKWSWLFLSAGFRRLGQWLRFSSYIAPLIRR